uniref:MFS domain-containing protein n=1 Tax=Ascaris lumbricoides TaxID=6252 RepID=A0A0M3I2P7_ASCLU
MSNRWTTFKRWGDIRRLAPPATFCERSNSTEANSNRLSCDVLNSTLQNSLCANSLHPQFYSANIEFGYLCDETKYIKRSISYQMIGLILGSILFGQLSDSYGRKWPMIVCLIGCVVTDFISSFATGLVTLTIYRAAALLFTGGQTAIWLVFMVENIPKKDRLWINMVVSWSPNIALFALIAYFCGDWKTLARVTGALTVPAIILALFICESPRWLIQKGKTEEAYKLVKKMIAFNGGPKIADDVIANVIAKENAAAAISAGNENFYMFHLFCTAQLTLYTFVYSFSYISTSIINYGVFFNMAKLPGSIYTNNIFIGLSRLASFFWVGGGGETFAWEEVYSYSCVYFNTFRWVVNAAVGIFDYKVKCFGRKALHAISLGIILIAVMIVFSLIQLDISEEYAIILRFCVLLIPIIASNVYIGNNVSSNELFPTPIRNAAFAFLQVVNRLGVAIAPQLFILVSHNLFFEFANFLFYYCWFTNQLSQMTLYQKLEQVVKRSTSVLLCYLQNLLKFSNLIL